VGALPGLLFALLTSTAVDVARAQAALSETRSPLMLDRFVGAFRLVFRLPRATIGIQVGAGALWLGLSAVYLGLAWPFGYRSALAFTFLTVLRQGLVLLRTGVRIGALGGTLALVEQAHRPSLS
jgi:hypothetical protein